MALVLLFGAVRMAHAARGRNGPGFIKYLFLCISILMITGMIFVSWGDHNRYRFEVDPFYLMLAVMAFESVLKRMSPASASAAPKVNSSEHSLASKNGGRGFET